MMEYIADCKLPEAQVIFYQRPKTTCNRNNLHYGYDSIHYKACNDLVSKGRGFEPHKRLCVVSLSKTHLSLLSTGSTEEDLSGHK